MKTLYSSVDIDASPQRVGSRLDARLEPPGGMGITMHPTVLEVVPGSALRWLGHLLVSGVFDGEHHFVLEPLETNRTRLVQQERFRGLLVPLFASSLDKHTLAGFHAMNAALRARAEAGVDRPAEGAPITGRAH